MATSDHKARACLSIPSGNASRVSPSADPPVSHRSPASLRLSTLDDVALALYALAQLCLEDERSRHVARHSDVPPLLPLAPLFRQGVAVAVQCLEQYARQLGQERALNA
jgi:hypothetical protein